MEFEFIPTTEEEWKEYYAIKYSDFEDDLVSKPNRKNNQAKDKNRMIVDGASTRDLARIQHKRYQEKWGK